MSSVAAAATKGDTATVSAVDSLGRDYTFPVCDNIAFSTTDVQHLNASLQIESSSTQGFASKDCLVKVLTQMWSPHTHIAQDNGTQRGGSEVW
jgi:hypothetical protein